MSTAAPESTLSPELDALINANFREFKEGSIVNGTIIAIRPQVVIVNIGYKSEGVIMSNEFDGEEIEVEVAFRSNDMRWLDPLAQLLPDDLEVIPIDNSHQGVYTIGDIKKEIKEQ